MLSLVNYYIYLNYNNILEYLEYEDENLMMFMLNHEIQCTISLILLKVLESQRLKNLISKQY